MLESFADTAIQQFKSIEERAEGISPPGLLSGFFDIDAVTMGFQPGDLICLCGVPATGKTALLFNIARNIASTQKLPVAIFSLEMSRSYALYKQKSLCINETKGFRLLNTHHFFKLKTFLGSKNPRSKCQNRHLLVLRFCQCVSPNVEAADHVSPAIQ